MTSGASTSSTRKEDRQSMLRARYVCAKLVYAKTLPKWGAKRSMEKASIYILQVFKRAAWSPHADITMHQIVPLHQIYMHRWAI